MGKKIAFIKLLICNFLFFNSLSFSCFAAVSAKLSKTKIGLNESVSLIITSDIKGHSEPDFTPLIHDFDILSTSQSHNLSIVNGHAKHETQWTLVLLPKEEGVFSIPVFQFDQEATQPLQIEVSGSTMAKNDDSLFVETEINPINSTYERSQILYTIRLYRSVNIGQATLTDPKINDLDAIIERVGQDSEYEHYHQNGTRYVVFERKYAVFPQHTGELIFSPVQFSGQIIHGHSFFNMQAEVKQAQSETQKIDILAIPAPFDKNNWLAAYDVSLSEAWSIDPADITVNEPVTWTLTLKANGCLGSLLPDMDLNIPDTLKQYRDKPEISNEPSNQGILGTKQIKIALIANQKGEIELPSIEIKWWDLNTNEVKISHLLARKIQIKNDSLTTNTIVRSDEIATAPHSQIETEIKIVETVPVWAWILSGLNLFWIALLSMILYKKRPVAKVKKTDNAQTLKEIKNQLKLACNINNAKLAETILLLWATLQFTDQHPSNLAAIKRFLNEPFQDAIDELNKNLYGHEQNWNGEALWQAFIMFKPLTASHFTTSTDLEKLEGLYSK